MSEVPNVNEALVLNVQQVYAYSADNLTEWVGYAPPGVKTSEARWKIKRTTKDSIGRALTVTYANGSINYDQVWDNYATLAYS